MGLPENIDTSYTDVTASAGTHQQHHDQLHTATNLLVQALMLRSLPEAPRSKYAHGLMEHGAVQAAIADLGTSGTSTVAQLEAKINAILAAMRARGEILP